MNLKSRKKFLLIFDLLKLKLLKHFNKKKFIIKKYFIFYRVKLRGYYPSKSPYKKSVENLNFLIGAFGDKTSETHARMRRWADRWLEMSSLVTRLGGLPLAIVQAG